MMHPCTTTNNTLIDRTSKLMIRQQNTNKSLVVQSDFLHQLDLTIYDIGVVQEPYLDHCHNSQATHNWYMLYPKAHYTNLACTHSLVLVNKRIVTDTWSQIDLSSSDITAIQLQTERGRVLIINMYNEGTQQQGIKWSIIAMRQRECTGHNDHNSLHIRHTIWLGDFNLH